MLAGAVLCMAPGWNPATRGEEAPGIDAQYQAVLEVLKRPPVSGVVVTEILPDSAAGAAGLRGGDVITSYFGTRINDLKTLREQVADAVADRLLNQDPSRVLLRARRQRPNGAEEDISIQLPREPLGIRGVEVEAGVPGPRNPPASPRGKLHFAWPALVETLRADPRVVLRTISQVDAAETRPAKERAAATDNEVWLGWQHYAFTPAADGEALSGTLEINRVDDSKAGAGAVNIDEKLTFQFQLRIGDGQQSPPFVLESLEATYPARALSAGRGDQPIIKATAARAGEMLRTAIVGTGGAPENREYRMPLDGIVQQAIPLVAGGLPQESGAVLGLHLVSVRDFVPRPGYVLATRGKQPLPENGAAATPPAFAKPPESAWKVDLLHCGMVIESYWFSDQRRLLAIRGEGPEPVVSRRVASLDEAGPARQGPSAATRSASAPAAP
jgi:hypothetical protein